MTKLKCNMKNRLMSLVDKILLRKRAIIETVNEQLKNISHIEQTRHRSISNAMVNMLAGLIAYTHQDTLPSLNLTRHISKNLRPYKRTHNLMCCLSSHFSYPELTLY
ncbi:transposase [Candidatus Moduliflexus flocculans]|uniref:Transposase n=1 Tax=Candidatus Moduliflexus flocculans TaxID=1499966 RepID=A0A081BRQ4_9BACT|nr:transposase [Candidatus Moduliflexus flocculans]